MSIKGLSIQNQALPHYLKALLVSLVLTACSVVLLRWGGFVEISALTNETPKALMLGLAFLLPSFSLALDFKYLKSTLSPIDSVDRLPLLLLLLAQLLWFYSFWLTTILLGGYLALVVFRFVLQWHKNKGNTQFLSELKSSVKQRAKEIPIYIWCLVALFFLNALGVLWQTQEVFPNTMDRYVLYVLLPMSLLLYRPKVKSVFQFARFALPFILALLSVYLIYVMLFHLVYFEDLWAWIRHPLSRIYQSKLFNDDTFKLYTDWSAVAHPSYTLLALLPYFLISFFAKGKGDFAKKEEFVFVLLTVLFVLFTHLRYGQYYIILMSLLHLFKAYLGAFKEFIKTKKLYILIGLGLLAGFLYQERELFVDNVRLELYRAVIDEIKAYPILGQGTGAELKLFFREGTLVNHCHTHNLLLSMMTNFGLIGFLWTTLFISSLFHKAINRNYILLFFLIFLLPMFVIETPFTLGSSIIQMLMSFIFISFINSKSDSTYAL